VLRRLGTFTGLAFLAGGILLGLYGVFAIVYRVDGGGNAYVTLAGREVDADSAGAIALLLGVVACLGAIRFLGVRWVLFVIALTLAVPSAILGILLVTSSDDPDGAAQAIGWLMLGAAGVLALIAGAAQWLGRGRSRRT
jgi:hypothetical protein